MPPHASCALEEGMELMRPAHTLPHALPCPAHTHGSTMAQRLAWKGLSSTKLLNLPAQVKLKIRRAWPWAWSMYPGPSSWSTWLGLASVNWDQFSSVRGSSSQFNPLRQGQVSSILLVTVFVSLIKSTLIGRFGSTMGLVYVLFNV